MHVAVAESTINSYRTGFTSYVNFCNVLSFNPIPVCKHKLMYYITASARRLSYSSTLRVYLAGIQFFGVMRGELFRICDMHQLFYLMRGIRRTQGTSLSRPVRRPITNVLLYSIVRLY